ncbi:MAG: proline--tRNA ligase, partial [Oscillospiraceae bacterium]|nr:proline--tRNA ligase [Oscillospiraceae bacterium]
LKSLAAQGRRPSVSPGSSGSGGTRCLAAIIEHSHDDDGIVWPVSVAPYKAIVVPANYKSAEQTELAEKIYSELKSQGIDALIDDRAERAGVKFKDADLIGIPVRV